MSAFWPPELLVVSAVSRVPGGLDPISATLKKLVMVPWSRVARPPELGHSTVILLRSMSGDFLSWMTWMLPLGVDFLGRQSSSSSSSSWKLQHKQQNIYFSPSFKP